MSNSLSEFLMEIKIKCRIDNYFSSKSFKDGFNSHIHSMNELNQLIDVMTLTIFDYFKTLCPILEAWLNDSDRLIAFLNQAKCAEYFVMTPAFVNILRTKSKEEIVSIYNQCPRYPQQILNYGVLLNLVEADIPSIFRFIENIRSNDYPYLVKGFSLRLQGLLETTFQVSSEKGWIFLAEVCSYQNKHACQLPENFRPATFKQLIPFIPKEIKNAYDSYYLNRFSALFSFEEIVESYRENPKIISQFIKFLTNEKIKILVRKNTDVIKKLPCFPEELQPDVLAIVSLSDISFVNNSLVDTLSGLSPSLLVNIIRTYDPSLWPEKWVQETISVLPLLKNDPENSKMYLNRIIDNKKFHPLITELWQNSDDLSFIIGHLDEEGKYRLMQLFPNKIKENLQMLSLNNQARLIAENPSLLDEKGYTLAEDLLLNPKISVENKDKLVRAYFQYGPNHAFEKFPIQVIRILSQDICADDAKFREWLSNYHDIALLEKIYRCAVDFSKTFKELNHFLDPNSAPQVRPGMILAFLIGLAIAIIIPFILPSLGLSLTTAGIAYLAISGGAIAGTTTGLFYFIAVGAYLELKRPFSQKQHEALTEALGESENIDALARTLGKLNYSQLEPTRYQLFQPPKSAVCLEQATECTPS